MPMRTIRDVYSRHFNYIHFIMLKYNRKPCELPGLNRHFYFLLLRIRFLRHVNNSELHSACMCLYVNSKTCYMYGICSTEFIEFFT